MFNNPELQINYVAWAGSYIMEPKMLPQILDHYIMEPDQKFIIEEELVTVNSKMKSLWVVIQGDIYLIQLTFWVILIVEIVMIITLIEVVLLDK